jgi:hypothetical protein
MATFSVPSTRVASSDQLVLRAAVSAYLGRYRGEVEVCSACMEDEIRRLWMENEFLKRVSMTARRLAVTGRDENRGGRPG